MGWKGTLRSMNAINNQYERERSKEEQIESAENLVEKQQDYLKEITSFHRSCGKVMDWSDVYKIPAPIEPKKENIYEDKARSKFKNFKPNFIYKKFNLVQWRMEQLEKSIEKAKIKDLKKYNNSVDIYNEKFSSWKEKYDEAQCIVNKNFESYLKIFEKYKDFNDDPIGEKVEFSINDNGFVELDITTVGMDDIIPDEEFSQRASGTLSTRNMSVSKKYDYYQDYVCSSLIRVVREVFRVLPVDDVLANVVIQDNNPMTGHLENMPIVSTRIDREKFLSLNLHKVDASEALKNFKYNMKFKKTKGFEVVKKVGV
ncbi:MAG: hypothetical protein GY793_08925 [Proteobacteria bacterium]|nr:hypothetical protein [Pseudomonadota bacterium]